MIVPLKCLCYLWINAVFEVGTLAPSPGKPNYTWLSSLIEAVGSLLKIVIISIVLIFLLAHWQYFSHWLEGVTHGEFFGLKFDRAAAEQKIDQLLIEKAKSGATRPFAIGALARAQIVLPAISGARVLWVDQNPEHNVIERGVLEDMGIKVQLALSTDQAQTYLRTDNYDLVISNVGRTETSKPLKQCPSYYVDFPSDELRKQYNDDLQRFNIDRQSDPMGGFAMAEVLAAEFPSAFGDRQVPRIIYYTIANGGKVADACSRIVTNRPDVLLQTVVSALEELRWRYLEKNTGGSMSD